MSAGNATSALVSEPTLVKVEKYVQMPEGAV